MDHLGNNFIVCLCFLFLINLAKLEVCLMEKMIFYLIFLSLSGGSHINCNWHIINLVKVFGYCIRTQSNSNINSELCFVSTCQTKNIHPHLSTFLVSINSWENSWLFSICLNVPICSSASCQLCLFKDSWSLFSKFGTEQKEVRSGMGLIKIISEWISFLRWFSFVWGWINRFLSLVLDGK